jgi:hypothetical protein
MDGQSGSSGSVTKLYTNLLFVVLSRKTAFDAIFWLNELSRENTKLARKYNVPL